MRPHHPAANITSPFLANGRVFWSLVTAIVAALIMLTGWTAVQASVVDSTLDGNGPEHPSIRQLERRNDQAVKEQQFFSVRQAERVGQHDAVDRRQQPSIRQAERAAQVRAEWLSGLARNCGDVSVRRLGRVAGGRGRCCGRAGRAGRRW